MLLDLGYGTFTGPSGFVTPDKRSVVFTIAQGKRPFSDEYHAGWAHNGGLPLQLWWDNGLKMQPIREILSCEEKMLLERTNCGIEELNHDLEKINSNRMYVKLTTDADEIVINTESVLDASKSVQVVYDRNTKDVSLFKAAMNGQKEVETKEIAVDDEALLAEIGQGYFDKLTEDIELLDGASAEFDLEQVQAGNLTPVFFGSALTNFGVETFLKHFLDMTTSPLPRHSSIGEINPFEEDFSAFVFKIQANMNKAHRDRIAFMRICSGKFEAGMEANHVQGGKKIRLAQPQQMMAQERHIVEEAYAGDIIGVFDPGIFSIGDTICKSNQKFEFDGIPTFAPEHFARVRQMDTMKRKQFIKGISQIAQEGAIQIFQEFNTGMEEIIVGVVGVLQFEVLEYRLKNEYNVEIKLEQLPYEYIRWIENPEEIDVNRIVGTSDMKKIKDLKDNPLLIFVNSWSVNMVLERNEGLKLSEFGKNN